MQPSLTLAKRGFLADEVAFTLIPIWVNVSAAKATCARSPVRTVLLRIGTDQNPSFFPEIIATPKLTNDYMMLVLELVAYSDEVGVIVSSFVAGWGPLLFSQHIPDGTVANQMDTGIFDEIFKFIAHEGMVIRNPRFPIRTDGT